MLITALGIQGCTNAPLKRSPEIWLIDQEDVLLYRKKNADYELVIPIKGNEEIKQFMCIHGDEFERIINER